MTKALIQSELTYYIQSREFRYGYWSQWNCSSPHYETLAEARNHFNKWHFFPNSLEEVRLVRARFLYERVPIKTPLYAKRGAKRRILARRSA